MSLLANMGSPLSHIDMSNNNIEDRGNTARDLFIVIKFFACGLYYHPKQNSGTTDAIVIVFFSFHKVSSYLYSEEIFFPGNDSVSRFE